MALWDDLEAQVRSQGVRVDERLRLLAMLRTADVGEDPINHECTAVKQAIKDAVIRVKDDIG